MLEWAYVVANACCKIIKGKSQVILGVDLSMIVMILILTKKRLLVKI